VFASASPDTICPADSVSLTALGSGGSGSYSFTWTSDPVGFSSLAQDTADFPVVTTTYYVEIFDGFNTNIDSVTVVVNPLPVADAGTDMMLCLGDTLSIDASASSGTPVLVFAWDNSLGAGVSHDVSPVLTTVYTVTVTDGNGCFSTDDVQITVLPLPVIDTVYVTDPLCFGDSTGTLIIETGNMDSLMHTIDNWASFQYDSLFTGLPAGTYDIVVEDTSGCQGLYQAVISEPTQLTVDTLYVTAASCGATGGTEVAASGGTSPYSYVWDSGDSTAVISNMPNGDYIVTVTDNNGCTAELTVNIPNAGGTGVVSITDTLMVSCYGLSDGSATAEMTGGTAPYSYEWSTTDTTAIVTGLAAGNYTVTVTDAFGCQGTTGITIIQPDSIYATFTEIPVSCYGDTDGEINLTVSGGESPYTYVWSTGDTLYTGLYGNLSPGGYEVTVVDGNGCKYVIIELTVGQPALLSVLASGFDPACDGDTTGNVTVAVSGGTIPYTFTWYHTGWTSSVSDQTINDLGSGTYYVTVSDFMNCQGTDYVTLYDPPEMQVVVTDTINNYQGEITVTVIGGTLPVTFEWSNGETDNTLTGLGSGMYNLTVTDGNSCVYMDSVEIQIPLIVPSLFTPNVDGFNDTWEITNIDVYEDLSIEIYNRWGDIVFTFSGSGAEYATEPWDGTWNGNEVPMGGYVYVIDLKNDTDPYTGVVSVKR
ncbi:MAG: gliding motility-associated C-terminal domain-containing protein, partial [Bacteroidota bacterium]